jgi:hypothetical protein
MSTPSFSSVFGFFKSYTNVLITLGLVVWAVATYKGGNDSRLADLEKRLDSVEIAQKEGERANHQLEVQIGKLITEVQLSRTDLQYLRHAFDRIDKGGSK